MGKRSFCFILAVILFLNCFTIFNFSFASEDLKDYIVGVDVSSIEPMFSVEFKNKNYLQASEHAKKALDIFEEELKNKFPKVEVFDRLTLLVPGVVIRASVNDIELIKSLRYVLNIYDNNKYNEPSELVPVRTRSRRSLSPMSHSIRNDIFKNNSLTGKGSVVSIIDSDMNPNHPAFNDNENIEEVVTENLSNTLHQGSYFSKKVPFRRNYYAEKIKNNEQIKNTNPNGIVNGHGQHVAGIAAGNKMKWGSINWQGIAPDSQVLMMHQNLEDHTITKSIEDSLLLKADVINLSLGSSFRTYSNKSIMQDAIDKVVNEGIVVSVAAGNSGDLSNLNLSTDNPSFSTLADPANSDSVIAVASSKNRVEYVNLIEFKTNSFEGHFSYEHINTVPVISGEYKLVENSDDLNNVTDNENVMWAGNVQDYNKLSDKSKIDLIITSSSSYTENNIPVISGLDSHVDKIKDAKDNLNNLTVKFLEPDDSVDYGKMSTFSSWGIVPGGSLKPDISAPGDRILSADNNGGLYLNQGTSMAAPVITGSVALFNEYYKNSPFKNLGGKDKAEIIKTVLMNSAIPYKNISPRQQGAGVVNIDKAISLDFTAVDSSNNIASKFVGDVDDSIELNLNIKNWSDIDKRLRARVEILVQENDGNKIKFTSRSAKSYDLEEFDLPTNDQINRTFNINISDVDTSAFKNGAFVDGFLYLSDGTNEISFPFASYKKAGKRGISDIEAVEKPVYDFDFVNERPIYWTESYVGKNTDWHKANTHIETRVESKIKKEDKTKIDIIAGMINAEDYKYETKPKFENLVFSKVSKTASTELFKPYFVVMRAGKFNTFVERKETGEKISENKFYVEINNFSKFPFGESEKNQINDIDTQQVIGRYYGGYVEMNSIDISNLPDGKYSYKIIAKPFDGSTKDINDFSKYGLSKEQTIEIPFSIDNTPPLIFAQVYEDDSKKLKFKVKDANGVKDVSINGQAIATNPDGVYEYTLNDGETLENLDVKATDIAYNEKTLKANKIPKEYSVVLMDGNLEIANVKVIEGEKLPKEAFEKISDYDQFLNRRKIGKGGYTITGWYKNSNLSGEEVDLKNATINEDTTLYAKWVPIQYDVKLYIVWTNKKNNKPNNLNRKVSLENPDLKFAIDEFKTWFNKDNGHNYKPSYEFNIKEYKIQHKVTDESNFKLTENLLPVDGQPVNITVDLIRKKFTIRLVNGDKVEIKEISYNEVIDGETFSKPTKEGYTFLGWFDEKGNKLRSSIYVTSDLTFTAKWTANKYEVKFMDGTNEISKTKVEHGKTVAEPTNPIKEGYEFKGWFTDKELNNEFNFNTLIKTNITLFAKFEKKKYNVEFVGATVNAQEVEHNGTVTRPENPSADGKTFVGWFADEQFNTPFNFGNPIKANTKIYAKWDAKTFTVTFNPDNNTEKTSKIVNYGENVEAPETPTKEGYYFVEWQIDGVKAMFPYEVKKDTTFNAKWDVKTYTVTFKNVENIYKTQTVEHGETVVEPQTPDNPGFKFNGWEIDGVKISFPYTVTSDLVINATWLALPKKINITFDFNQASIQNKVVEIEEGNKVSEPTFNKKITVGSDEFEFKGWYLDAELTKPADLTKTFNESTTLYAKWEKFDKPVEIVKYNVVFNNDGVTKTVEVGEGKLVTEPEEPTKEGHIFLGWFDGNSKFDFTKPITNDLNLVAKWEEIVAPTPEIKTHKVTFINGNDINVVEVEDGKSVLRPVNPVKVGYLFLGWYDGLNRFDFSSKITKDLRLIAIWQEISAPDPKPEPKPEPKPYEPAPYYPNDNYRPSDYYTPSDEYRPIIKKDEPKSVVKEEIKSEIKLNEKLILVSAPTLPVNLIDIPKGEVGDAITSMVARGVLVGTGENKYEPDLTITRAMVTEVFMRISADKSIEDIMNFDDVKSGDWFENSVKWAADKNIVKGFEDGSFKPNQKVTLQEFAAMIARMLSEYKIEMPKRVEVDANNYPYLPDWSRDVILKTIELGLIEVNSKDDLTREVSRAELAVVLNKIIETVEQK